MGKIPKSAHVVVIGGGVIGCSVAYHLAKMGLKDVLLLEKSSLTSGTTWHAAGLMVTFGSFSHTSTMMRLYSRNLYKTLPSETGQDTGFLDIGFIEIATDEDRLEEYKRVAAFNRLCGVDVHEISGKEVHELFPIAKTDDILAAFYVKEDGRVNPVDATISLAKGATLYGAKIIENTPVIGFIIKNGAVKGVKTSYGDIETEYVVNAAGMWARQLGNLASVNIPNQAAEHYYLITEDIKGIPSNMPVLEDPSSYGYYRNEGGGLMIGLFEPVCAPWKLYDVPMDFSFGEIPPDWDRMTPYLEKAMKRIPLTMNVGLKKLFCGPESFTADLKAIIGEAPEVKNYFVAAGLNSIGIIIGPGIGKLIAQWIIDGDPGIDITEFNIDRLHNYQNNPLYRKHRTVESLGLVYRHHYPTRTAETARCAKCSPFYDRLKAAGAYFKDVSGWEGADWFAPSPSEAKVDKLSWGRQNFFPYWKAEHEATRENVILMDMTFMSKWLIQGKDAGKFLNYISANNVDKECGKITYTQWLNKWGKLEADVTVTKLSDDKFIVVSTDTMHRHVETWMKRHIPKDYNVFITDVTSSFGQLNVQGPRSRELLQTLTSADLSNKAFPYRTAREIDIGYARVICVRITYLGELGYELYIPSEQALHVYDILVEEGKKFNLKHAGLKALGSLRLEKAYRDYGHDMDNTDNVFEAGLEFAVAFNKPCDFIGKNALIKIKSEALPPKRRLVQVLVKDPNPLIFHGEIILKDNIPVGYVRSGSYGFTLGGAVGLAMIERDRPIDDDYIKNSNWKINIAGKLYPLVVSITPLYDPKMERIKS